MEGLENYVSLEVIRGMERECDELSYKVALRLTIIDEICKTGLGKNYMGPRHKQTVLLAKGRTS